METQYQKITVLDPEQIKQEFSADYWNDSEKEKGKIWGKWETHFDELTEKFQRKGLLDQFESIVADHQINLSEMEITSLASGICLLEAQILNSHPEVKKMTCLEFSKHRIFDIAPGIFSKYQTPVEKVELRLGSFLDTQIPDSSQDLVILSQAFHHTSDTSPLLKEVERIIKPDGHVIIIGEHFFSEANITKRFFKHFIKYAINHNDIRERSPFFPDWRSLFPIDKIKGDHHYNLKMYRSFFNDHGYQFKRYIFRDFMNQGFHLKRSK